VKTYFCSPATVCHQAACDSVNKWTTGAPCAPWPLALLPHDVPPWGPPVTRSVAPGLCIFVTAGFARLRQRAVASACASVNKWMTGATCASWPLVILPHDVSLRAPPVARSVAPGLWIFSISKCQSQFARNPAHLVGQFYPPSVKIDNGRFYVPPKHFHPPSKNITYPYLYTVPRFTQLSL